MDMSLLDSDRSDTQRLESHLLHYDTLIRIASEEGVEAYHGGRHQAQTGRCVPQPNAGEGT